MSKPKNMTPEQEAAWKEKHRAKDKAYREANAEKVRAKKKAYREANAEKERATRKAYCEANAEKVRATQKAYREANAEKVRARQKSYCDSLTARYVLKVIGLPLAECPPELLDIKRNQLVLKRSIKQLKEHIQHENTGA